MHRRLAPRAERSAKPGPHVTVANKPQTLGEEDLPKSTQPIKKLSPSQTISPQADTKMEMAQGASLRRRKRVLWET
jgi:hypothetical protein